MTCCRRTSIPPDLLTRLVRALPWILLVGSLLGIFIFTAYATANRDGEGYRCVVLSPGVATDADCGDAGARQVLIEVLEVGRCPEGTEPFQPQDRNLALCLAIPE